LSVREIDKLNQLIRVTIMYYDYSRKKGERVVIIRKMKAGSRFTNT